LHIGRFFKVSGFAKGRKMPQEELGNFTGVNISRGADLVTEVGGTEAWHEHLNRGAPSKNILSQNKPLMQVSKTCGCAKNDHASKKHILASEKNMLLHALCLLCISRGIAAFSWPSGPVASGPVGPWGTPWAHKGLQNDSFCNNT